LASALKVEALLVEALLLVAEHDGPTMFARIGVMRALNRHVERVFKPSRKAKHWVGGNWQGSDEGRARNYRRAQPDGLEHRRSWVFITDGPPSLG
jgi:hypothetical protein